MMHYLKECNSGALQTDPQTFQEIWCKRCSQKQCDLAGYAKTDPMALRNETWREKYFGLPQADLTIPHFAQIATQDFADLMQKALRLEISERRGDWSVPELPATENRIVTPADPAPPAPVQIEESPTPTAAPVHVSRPVVLPPLGNAPDPGAVTMGGAVTAPSTPAADPWAAPPKPTERIVKAGARIQFGTNGKVTVEDS